MKTRPIVIGLVGLTGAGKSTAARMLIDDYRFELVRPGDHIRDKILNSGKSQTPETEREFQLAVRQQHGMGILMEMSLPEIKAAISQNKNVLVDSMCSFSEVSHLHKLVRAEDVHVIAVHTAARNRPKRLAQRLRRPLSAEQMKERDLLEIDQLEKGKLLALADHHLVNGTDETTFKTEVRALIEKIIAHNKG